MTPAKVSRCIVLICAVFLALNVYSQASIEKLDVYTKTAHRHSSPGFSLRADSIMAKINSIPDSAGMYVTIVVTLSSPVGPDSLSLTLNNSLGSQIYNAVVPFTQMEGESGFGATGRTYRLKVGPYPYMKKFVATAAAITSGNVSPALTFTKN